jgi:hypothetical protein
MKKLLMLLLFIPAVSFGQKLEFTDMAGISIGTQPNIPRNVSLFPDGGLSNRLTASYYFTSFFSLGAIFGINAWGSNQYTLGLTADFQFKWAYVGAELSYLNIQRLTFNADDPNVRPYVYYATFDPAVQLGLHAGLRQRLARRLYIKEEMDTYFANVTSNTDNAGNVTNKFRYSAILVGLSYRFPIKHNTTAFQSQ